MDINMLWGEIALFLYAIGKAFLPLPSLEVVLVPLLIAYPMRWIYFVLEGAIGTFFGGLIGYYIAYFLGKGAFRQITTQEDLKKGEYLLNRYGVLAVFIGGITPIPDFLLAYLAGFAKMNVWLFVCSDTIARLLRSILVAWSIYSLGSVIDMEKFGILLSYSLLIFLILRWLILKFKVIKHNRKNKE